MPKGPYSYKGMKSILKPKKGHSKKKGGKAK